MSTTLHLTYKRFVRRADSGLITNTQFLAAMDTVDGKLKTEPWVETDLLDAVHPVNSPSLGGFAGQAYDAYRQSGDAASGTGRQCVYGGMALYRFSVPASASGTFINSLYLKVSGDKFLVGGLTIAAILSDSATPPTDWTLLRTGGVNATVDTSSQFAASAVVAETATLVSQSQNRTDAITLDLSDETSYHPWLWVAVSLTTFASYRREYWVEGSGALVGAECTVTFAGEVTPDSDPYVLFFPKAYKRELYNLNLHNEYDVDLSIRMHRVNTHLTADALTGYRHYQSLLEQRHWPVETFLTMTIMGISGDSSRGYPVLSNLIVAGLDVVGFGVSTVPEYQSAKYMLCSLLYGRTARTNGETALGISFDTAIPAPPAGVVFRLSIYGTEAGYVTTSGMNNGYTDPTPRTHAPAQLNTRSMVDPDFWDGIGDTLFFKTVAANEKSSSSFQEANSSITDGLPASTAALSVPVTAIASIELTAELAAGAVVPFATPYTLPKFSMIFAALTVGRVESTYAQSKDTSDFKQWWPKDFHLHI